MGLFQSYCTLAVQQHAGYGMGRQTRPSAQSASSPGTVLVLLDGIYLSDGSVKIPGLLLPECTYIYAESSVSAIPHALNSKSCLDLTEVLLWRDSLMSEHA
jgi:hypothetical protein